MDELNLNFFKTIDLRGYQLEFIFKFLQSKEKYWKLISPTGSGKTYTGAAIISYLINNNKKNFLIISPRTSLLIQWFEVLKQVQNEYEPLIINRKILFDLEFKRLDGNSLFPDFKIILMSSDLAQRQEIINKILRVKWDFLIIDESHLFMVGERLKLLTELLRSEIVDRALLLTSIKHKNLDIKLKDEIITLEQNMDYLLHYYLEKKIMPIYFHRTYKEQTLIKKLYKLSKTIQSFEIMVAVSSSIFTINEILKIFLDNLRYLRNKIAHNMIITKEEIMNMHNKIISSFDEEYLLQYDLKSLKINKNNVLYVYKLIEDILQDIENVGVDSKILILKKYLLKNNMTNKYICIRSSFTNTIEYLYSNLIETNISIYVVNENMTYNETKNNLETFMKKGGILIFSDQAIPTEPFPFVNICINYDLPNKVELFENIWERFLSYNRNTHLQMMILVDKSKILKNENTIVNNLLKEYNI